MKNKLISITLAAAVMLSTAFIFSGCGDKDYPVTVANFTIDKKPENIVILDPSTADIVSFMGYDVKMVGRSDEVDQEWMSVVPSVGAEENPDIEKIKQSGASIVFAGSNLDDNIKKQLDNNNIQVITMSKAQTQKQLETNYVTLGKILGGKVTGSNHGADSYNELINDMDEIKSTVTSLKSSDVLYTVCYLYTENNSLKMMTSGTYGDMILGYTGAVNAAVNIEDNSVDVSTLKIANPNFIFYSDDATLQSIKRDLTLKKLTAVKKGKMSMISLDELNRQGQTALDTLQKMIDFMYPELANTAVNATAASNASNSTTAPVETTTASNESVADKYKIDLDDDLSLKAEDENDNVKAMQKRLYDLGYITDKENITGFYGEISQAAVEEFQKNNGIKETGTANNETLTAMFSNDAEKAN